MNPKPVHNDIAITVIEVHTELIKSTLRFSERPNLDLHIDVRLDFAFV